MIFCLKQYYTKNIYLFINNINNIIDGVAVLKIKYKDRKSFKPNDTRNLVPFSSSINNGIAKGIEKDRLFQNLIALFSSRLLQIHKVWFFEREISRWMPKPLSFCYSPQSSFSLLLLLSVAFFHLISYSDQLLLLTR